MLFRRAGICDDDDNVRARGVAPRRPCCVLPPFARRARVPIVFAGRGVIQFGFVAADFTAILVPMILSGVVKPGGFLFGGGWLKMLDCRVLINSAGGNDIFHRAAFQLRIRSQHDSDPL